MLVLEHYPLDFVASQVSYDRVTLDLAYIKSQFPEVSHIKHQPDWAPHTLIVILDSEGDQAYLNGTYNEWDCLNGYYGVSLIDRFPSSPTYVLYFPGVFNMETLAAEYSKLGNVKLAEPNYIYGDGPDICFVNYDGINLYYVFDDAWGDCMAGCMYHSYSAYMTTNGVPGATPIYEGMPVFPYDPVLQECQSRL